MLARVKVPLRGTLSLPACDQAANPVRVLAWSLTHNASSEASSALDAFPRFTNTSINLQNLISFLVLVPILFLFGWICNPAAG